MVIKSHDLLPILVDYLGCNATHIYLERNHWVGTEDHHHKDRNGHFVQLFLRSYK